MLRMCVDYLNQEKDIKLYLPQYAPLIPLRRNPGGNAITSWTAELNKYMSTYGLELSSCLTVIIKNFVTTTTLEFSSKISRTIWTYLFFGHYYFPPET